MCKTIQKSILTATVDRIRRGPLGDHRVVLGGAWESLGAPWERFGLPEPPTKYGCPLCRVCSVNKWLEMVFVEILEAK